jgi:hypothetical protein
MDECQNVFDKLEKACASCLVKSRCIAMLVMLALARSWRNSMQSVQATNRLSVKSPGSKRKHLGIQYQHINIADIADFYS